MEVTLFSETGQGQTPAETGFTPPADKNGHPGQGQNTVKASVPECSLTHQAFIEKPQDVLCLGIGNLGPSMPSPWRVGVSPEY